MRVVVSTVSYCTRTIKLCRFGNRSRRGSGLVKLDLSDDHKEKKSVINRIGQSGFGRARARRKNSDDTNVRVRVTAVFVSHE